MCSNNIICITLLLVLNSIKEIFHLVLWACNLMLFKLLGFWYFIVHNPQKLPGYFLSIQNVESQQPWIITNQLLSLVHNNLNQRTYVSHLKSLVTNLLSFHKPSTSAINGFITPCNKLHIPVNTEHILSSAYISNTSKACLTVDNLVSALICLTFVPIINKTISNYVSTTIAMV